MSNKDNEIDDPQEETALTVRDEDEDDFPDAVVIADPSHKIDWKAPPPGKSLQPFRKTRHDKQLKFLGAFAAGGSISGAARVAGVAVETTVRWRKSDPWFKERFQEAEQVYRDFLQDMVHDRVVNGVEVPIKGKRFNSEVGALEDDIIGYRRDFNVVREIFHVKAHIPQYRDKPPEDKPSDTDREGFSALDRITRRLNEKAARQIIDVTPVPEEVEFLPSEEDPEE